MGYEAGGRADKRGNVYENRYLARLLLKLVSEEISAVVVEPVGEDTNTFEYYTISQDNKRTYYQCKGNNGVLDHWRPSDLQKHNVFSRSKKLLLEDFSSEYKFVSPCYYDELDELCNRARTCDRPKEFLDLVSNGKLRSSFSACERYYNLHRDNPKELQQLKDILSRCEFLVLPDNSNSVEDLTRLVGLYFIGAATETRVFLENYVNDTGSYGIKITANNILAALKAGGIYSRNIRFDPRIAPRIERLNETFSAAYPAINGNLFHRSYTGAIIQSIEDGKSVIVHGKAGSGKSGCIHELAEYLKSKEIPYLALRLDKNTPSEYADKYGEGLGLKESPVFGLNRIAAGNNCVLLLDQLDSLRWASANSSTALDVCKEMIRQAKDINENHGGHISIVFCCRTFDLETDSGIKDLFRNETEFFPWVQINVGELSSEEVHNIIGPDYNNLPKRVKNLLQTPSSLYVWSKLSSNKRNNVSSPQQMIFSWWNEILNSSESHIQNKNDLILCVDKMVSKMSQRSCFALPVILFQDYMKEVEYLASSGLIAKADSKIAFAHQSILDAFLIHKDLELIYGRESLLQVVTNWQTQTPSMRYRFSALLQNLIDSDQPIFINEAKQVLTSPSIHFYFKCAIFEVVGQYQTPDDSLFKLIDDFNGEENWHGVIKNVVFANHIVYLQHLAEDKDYNWLGDEGLSLLWTVRSSAPSFVADILREGISSEENMEKVFSVLSNCIDEEPEELFLLRVEIYEKNIELLRHLHYINIKDASPAHITTILKLFLRHSELYDKTHLYLQHEETGNFVHKNFSLILSELFETLCEQSNVVPIFLYPSGSYYHREWYPRQHEQSVVRDIVDLVKKSMIELATVNPEEALHYVSLSKRHKNAISNEIVLSALLALHTTYSDHAINWLLSDFEKNIVDCVSNENDYLHSCKKVIEKHSPFCSEENFRRLEEKIFNWCDDREKMIDRYKDRIEYNRASKEEPIYWAFWGGFQKDLLPMLDMNRTSSKTKDLISVLSRNDWVKKSNYHAGIIIGSAHSVVSTIHDRAEKLSDKTWLKIISSNINREHRAPRRDGRYPYYYETSHSMFASDMGKCAEKDPERFAKLSLRFSEDTDPVYIINVTDVLGKDISSTIGFDLVCQVIRHYMSSSNENLVINLLGIITNRANEEWPENVIKYVIETATGSMRPVGNENIFSGDNDKEILSPYDIATTAINLPRSEAVYTIAHLLNEHPSYEEIFRPVLKKLSEDESDAVRFALVPCIASFYQYDSEFATSLFDTLLNRDLRIISARNAFWLMGRNIEKYYPFLMQACKSPSQELAEEAAHLLCIIAIRTANQTVLDFLCSKNWPKNIIDTICGVAVESFECETFRQVGQQILEYFISNFDDNSIRLDGLFWNNRLDLHRDKDLILLILKKQSCSDGIYAFVEFLKNQNAPEITEFAEVISGFIQGTIDNSHSWEIEDGLVSIVISLIDRSGDDETAMGTCLDILDTIYQKGIFTNSAISRLMEGAE